MATPKSQRIGIWIIAIVMLVGTIGSFAVMILSSENSAKDQAQIQKISEQYQKDYQVYEDKVNAQAKELSKKYYSEFKKYESRPAKFDGSKVKSLNKNDIKVGTGSTLTEKSTFTAYYIGWTPNGQVFDGSFEDGALKAPLKVMPGGVIEGWTKGADGMKVGGIRELAIPSGQAYGEEGSGDKIPANSPLKFVLMVIPTPEAIAEPAVPQELIDYYNQNGLQ